MLVISFRQRICERNFAYHPLLKLRQFIFQFIKISGLATVALKVSFFLPCDFWATNLISTLRKSYPYSFSWSYNQYFSFG